MHKAERSTTGAAMGGDNFCHQDVIKDISNVLARAKSSWRGIWAAGVHYCAQQQKKLECAVQHGIDRSSGCWMVPTVRVSRAMDPLKIPPVALDCCGSVDGNCCP